ncbi:MAG: ribonuclease III [Chloroflexota bacterium]|nr:ribonuclease III [Chloroflexota bacterium]
MAQDFDDAESARAFARRLGLVFSKYFLLSRALTHRSYRNEHPEALEDNERLEFLGDAVLDFLVGAWLYNRFPEMAEGQLTRMRSALVRTEQLADFAIEIGVGAAMRLGRGEAESGGSQRPALLCAAFEALIGAIYLDMGIDAVHKFVEPLLNAVAGEIYSSGEMQDPKSRLQEWTQARGNGAPTYRTVSTTGPDHNKVFEIEVIVNDAVCGRGKGHSKQIAAKAAAREALQDLGLD